MPLFRFFMLLFVTMLSLPAAAQPLLHMGPNTAKTLVLPQAALQRTVAAQMDRAIFQASHAARLAQANREAYFSSAQTLPFQGMATVSAPAAQLPARDALFAFKNDKMALRWFETIEKDVNFLQDMHTSIAKSLEVKRIAPQEMDYAALIPAQARKIFVGEEHNTPAIYQAFEQMIFQYQQRYPRRKIIILTEFVSDRLFPWQQPGQPVSRWEMPLRRHDDDFTFFTKFIKRGIDIIGLENVAYVKEHETLITPSESQAQSVYGMQERNAHWRQIISAVAARNPEAVLFIYTGSMHSHYRAPFSLSNPSPQNFVLQLESRTLGTDMPFGFVMSQEPFTQAYGNKLTVLRWTDKDPVFRTRSGFDACILFPRGTQK